MHRLALMLVAFLSGAILMALELVGSRLLAPYFGGSIFVWGSLIGVFLAALSTGYYLGGRLVDRWPSPPLLAALLLAAGLYVLLLPHYGGAVCDRISLGDYGARAGPLISCALLFFLPGALMGVTSPFVVRLSAQAVEVVGRTAGAVYATSTIGSIAGTLGTAFYLIPAVGTRTALYLLAGGLVFTSLIAAAKRLRELTAGSGNGDRPKELRKQLRQVETEIANVMAAIKQGIVAKSVAAELKALEARQDKLQDALTRVKRPATKGLDALLADLPQTVSALVDDLRSLLVNGQAAEAKAILGQVLDEVELKPARTKDGRPYLIARLKGSLKRIIPLLAKRDDGNLVVAGAR